MLPLSLISNIWLFDFLPPPCSFHSPDSPQSLCRSIHVYMLSGSFADNPQDPFFASLHFDVWHLWKDHRLARKKGIFVHRMSAYKTTKELCFFFFVVSPVYSLVFASCLWLPSTTASRSSLTALWWRSPSSSLRGFQSSLRRSTGTALQQRQLWSDPFLCAACWPISEMHVTQSGLRQQDETWAHLPRYMYSFSNGKIFWLTVSEVRHSQCWRWTCWFLGCFFFASPIRLTLLVMMLLEWKASSGEMLCFSFGRLPTIECLTHNVSCLIERNSNLCRPWPHRKFSSCCPRTLKTRHLNQGERLSSDDPWCTYCPVRGISIRAPPYC